MNAIDRDSILITSAFFVKKDWTVSATECEFDTLDLIAERKRDGKRIGIECKGRNCPHDFYGDAIIDFAPKYTDAVASIEAGAVDAVLVANTFADGILSFSMMQNGAKTQPHLAPHTSHFADRRRIPKEFWRMEQEARYRYTSGADGFDFGRVAQ